MAILAWPLDNTDYTAQSIGAYTGTRTRGVFSAEDCLRVAAQGGRTVAVSPGIGWLQKEAYWGLSVFVTEPVVLELDVASGTLARYVAVVCRLDKAANVCEIVLRYGELSSAPQRPQPVRDLYYDEIFLAMVLQRAGSVAIGAADIEDLRLDEQVCGLMRDGVTGIPTAALEGQARGLIAQLQEELAQANEGALYAIVVNETADFPTDGWSETAPYTQTVAAAKMAAAYEPVADIVLEGTPEEKTQLLEAWGCVSELVMGSGEVTAVCWEDKPDMTFRVRLKAVV